jgi:hypothetical protein
MYRKSHATSEYPNCECTWSMKDGRCDNPMNLHCNTEECGWEGGDCLEWNEKYPNCQLHPFTLIGNGECDRQINAYHNTEECGWEGGDCLEFNEKYPNCKAFFPKYVGDGLCEDPMNEGDNTEECGWEGGDCLEFNEKYPNCKISKSFMVGNGKCEDPMNEAENTEECGWGGGDCLEFNEKYPNCKASKPFMVGNGKCSSRCSDCNTEACDWEGGDCLIFNAQFPGCKTSYPNNIGNGSCNLVHDNEECSWDGGDCLDYPKVTSCSDSFLKAKIVNKNGRKIWQGCDWVARKDTDERCKLNGVASHCPLTCNASCDENDEAIDSILPFKFWFYKRLKVVAKTCKWLGRMNTHMRVKYCRIPLIEFTCRKTCNPWL